MSGWAQRGREQDWAGGTVTWQVAERGAVSRQVLPLRETPGEQRICGHHHSGRDGLPGGLGEVWGAGRGRAAQM